MLPVGQSRRAPRLGRMYPATVHLGNLGICTCRLVFFTAWYYFSAFRHSILYCGVMMNKERGQWSSRVGFVLAAAGSAIGLGAIWKFPYMAGSNGGGAFLLLYLLAVLGIGLAMMLAELAIGRATRTDPVGAFRALGGRAWSFFGYSNLAAAFIILSFYCVVGGWTVGYLIQAATGSLLVLPPGETFKSRFDTFAADPAGSLALFAVFMTMTLGILLGGVKKGIERVSKVLMPILFFLMLIIIARSVTLPGAVEGIRFFLMPDLSRITPGVLVDALGFACFSLSLGVGSMLIYGSYLDRSENIAQSALWVVLLQTLATLLSGFMILPAVFAAGLPPGEGAGLTYITLPAVFQAMPGGHFFATVFFALLLIAALTSSVSILEPLTAYLIDQFRIGRVWACCIMAGGSFIAGIPASWSFGGAEVGTWLGKTPFQLMDYVTSNVMLPVNVLAACLLMGWSAKAVFRRELLGSPRERTGEQGRLPRWAFWIETICRIAAPAVIVAIFAANIFPARS